MKYAFLLFACLGSAILTRAQTSNTAAGQDCIAITVSNDSMSVSFKGKEVIVHSNQALDSCLQKIISGLNQPTILFDTPNDMDQEKKRAIGVLLEKFHCPVMRFWRFDPVIPPATRRLDTVSH